MLVDLAERVEREIVRTSGAGLKEFVGGVTVSTGDGFVDVVTQAIDRFTQKNPGCTVDLLIDAAPAKLSRDGVDVALRTVHLREPSLIYRRAAALALGLYCRPDLAGRLGPAPAPGQAPMIDLTPPLDQIPHLKAAKALGFVSVRFRVSTFSAQLAAIKSGLGIGVLPDMLADGLVQPFGRVPLPQLEVYLVSRPEALRQPHVRVFFDTLKTVIGEALTFSSK